MYFGVRVAAITWAVSTAHGRRTQAHVQVPRLARARWTWLGGNRRARNPPLVRYLYLKGHHFMHAAVGGWSPVVKPMDSTGTTGQAPPGQLPRWAAPSAHPLRGMNKGTQCNAAERGTAGQWTPLHPVQSLALFVIASLPIHFSIFHLSFVIIIPLCSVVRLSDALYRILCFSFIRFVFSFDPSPPLSLSSISSHPTPTVGLAFP